MDTSDNTVLIGNKPTMNYVLAVVTLFNGGQSSVRIKARGRAISRAVDVAEIVRNRFVREAKVAAITIGTDRVPSKDGREQSVSAIDILIER